MFQSRRAIFLNNVNTVENFYTNSFYQLNEYYDNNKF